MCGAAFCSGGKPDWLLTRSSSLPAWVELIRLGDGVLESLLGLVAAVKEQADQQQHGRQDHCRQCQPACAVLGGGAGLRQARIQEYLIWT